MTHHHHQEEVGRDICNMREDETCKDVDIVKADVKDVDSEKADADAVDVQGLGIHEGGRGRGLCEGRHARTWTS